MRVLSTNAQSRPFYFALICVRGSKNELQLVDVPVAFSAQEVRYSDIIKILRICNIPLVLLNINASWFSGRISLLGRVPSLRDAQRFQPPGGRWQQLEFRPSLNLYAANLRKVRARFKSIRNFTSFLVQKLHVLVCLNFNCIMYPSHAQLVTYLNL